MTAPDEQTPKPDAEETPKGSETPPASSEGAPSETPKSDDAPAPKAEETPAPKKEDPPAPEWDGPYDEERAKRLVANLRKERDDIKAERDGYKTVAERVQSLEEAAAKAQRDLTLSNVVNEYGVPDELVSFLTGKDEEELKAQAAVLATHVKPSQDGLRRRPAPAMRPGHGGPAPEPDFDPAALARQVRDAY